MEITLAPNQEKLVKEVMTLCGYESEEQAVAAIFRSVEQDYDIELMMPKAVVRAELQKAIDQSDRGEGRPWNLQEFLADARARLAKEPGRKKTHA